MLNRQALNDTQLRNVNVAATLIVVETRYPSHSDTHYHEKCGGVIKNVGDPLASCVCSTCGEKHYLLTGFKSYTLGIRTKE